MPDLKHPYAMNAKLVMVQLETSTMGLSEEEARRRLAIHGYNELKRVKRVTPLQIFLNQFTNVLVILLLVATVVSVLIDELLDAAAMAFIVVLSAVLGFVQEYRAERAIEMLEKITTPTAKVIRHNKTMQIPAKELVPGDIVLLEAGDIVPADGRVFESYNLQIDEASLTGESVPSKKVTESFRLGTSIADQENMAFMGTIVTYGKAFIVLINTGMHTELGKVASSIQEVKETKTPLQIKFERMARQIGMAVIMLCAIVFLLGIMRQELSIEKLLIFSISLAVAGIPSSLPAIVTISLALGVRTLSSKNMIVRKLPAAETLGAVTVICSDKTGTLTKNQMTITQIYANDRKITVSGTGYDPTGSFSENGVSLSTQPLEFLFLTGILCNNAELTEKTGKETGRWTITGDPTEGALLVLAQKAEVNAERVREQYSRIEELPFDAERKRMTVIAKNNQQGKVTAYVKGAPEMTLAVCDRIQVGGTVRKLTAADRKQVHEMNTVFASQALRVLALAYKDVKQAKAYPLEQTEGHLIFLGLVGMIDPPRDEVSPAVAECHAAGIKMMIITGDHALTAKAVAKQIGMFTEGDVVLTGDELDRMTEQELDVLLPRVRIIARSLPIQKSRIVAALQLKGHVVAMTGDGVNDAPAIKTADIGIAMGITGTDVAKEVSKAILVDDNFATIVNAVREGRNIYDKIIKSTRYLLSCNMGEIISVFLAIALNFPLPLIPLQILLMNLLTDGLPALGLGMEPSEADAMKRPPHDTKESPLTSRTVALILFFGFVMGSGTLFMFHRYLPEGMGMAQTVAFTTLVMFEMFAVIGSRSLHAFRHANLFSNRWLLAGIASSIIIQFLVIYWEPLRPIFGTVPLTLYDWILILIVSSLGYMFMEIGKFFLPRPHNH